MMSENVEQVKRIEKLLLEKLEDALKNDCVGLAQEYVHILDKFDDIYYLEGDTNE